MSELLALADTIERWEDHNDIAALRVMGWPSLPANVTHHLVLSHYRDTGIEPSSEVLDVLRAIEAATEWPSTYADMANWIRDGGQAP